MLLFQYKWTEFLFHRGCSFDVISILKSGLIIAGGRERKEDRPSSSHFSTLSGTIQMKKNLARTSLCREKYTPTESGSLVRTPSTGSNWTEHNAKDYSSGKPDLMPQLQAASSVLADFIYKVLGERTLYGRLSTLRLAPKMCLGNQSSSSCGDSVVLPWRVKSLWKTVEGLLSEKLSLVHEDNGIVLRDGHEEACRKVCQIEGVSRSQ